VNGNAVANATQIETRDAHGILGLTTHRQEVAKGQLVQVPIHGAHFKEILGCQFTLEATGLTYVGVEPGAWDVSGENIGLHPGSITFSWNSTVATSTPDVLFTMSFMADRDGGLDEMLQIGYRDKVLTPVEAYNIDEELLDISFTYDRSTNLNAPDFALYQNEPNPFADHTVIGFSIPKPADVTMTVFDALGKVIWTVREAFGPGYHVVRVNRKDLPGYGVMYYRLDAGDFSAARKMVLIE
jgi:hypothetical protein